MPDIKQLQLSYDGKTFEQRWWALVLIELNRIVDEMGLKEAAFAIDVQPSHLAHALAERNRHHVRAEWVLPLLLRSRDMGLAKAIMEPAGLAVREREQLTAEEKLERLERTLGETLGPDLRRSIYDKAWRRK